MDNDVMQLLEQILTGTAPPSHEAHSLEDLMMPY